MPSAFEYHCRAGPRSDVLTWYCAVRKPRSKAVCPFSRVLWTTATAEIETVVIRTAAIQTLMPALFYVLPLGYWRNGNRIRIFVDYLLWSYNVQCLELIDHVCLIVIPRALSDIPPQDRTSLRSVDVF